jgi:hypothetical protein
VNYHKYHGNSPYNVLPADDDPTDSACKNIFTGNHALVSEHLYNSFSFSLLLKILRKPPARMSRGRRKSGHLEDFNLLIKQIEMEGAGFLNTVDVELNYL